jgi:pimeloyl-ACP methyl ester carboxylesterase
MPAKIGGMAKVEGADLFYEIAGNGAPLVLLHAGFVDCGMWDEQFPEFAKEFRVLRYDRRGFGRSRFTPGTFSHRDDLRRLLDFLSIERAHFVGCSAGGGAAIDFTLEHPDRTASLTLISSALGGYPFRGEMPKLLQDLTAAIQSENYDQAADLAVRLWIDGPRRARDQVDLRIRKRALEMSRIALPNAFLQEESLTPAAYGRLHELKVPTLILTGELDDPWVQEIGDYLLAEIRGARRQMIAGTAHLPNMEKPEAFNRLVLSFLMGITTPSPSRRLE